MGDRRAACRVWAERSEERRQFGRLRQDEEIILRWIFRKWDGGMDWIDLARDRDSWRAFLNAVMRFEVPQNEGNFLTS